MSDLGIGDLVTALGLVFVIEGLLLAIAPDALRRVVATVLAQPIDSLRIAGVASALVGLAIVWLARG